jgi:hypothetical protein
MPTEKILALLIAERDKLNANIKQSELVMTARV